MIKIELSLDSRLSDILASEQGRAAFDACLPGMRRMVEGQPSVSGFTARRLIAYAGGKLPAGVAEKLDTALRALEVYGEDPMEAIANAPLTADGASVEKEPPRTAIHPGRVWRDTHGKRIQAHGGALLYEDGTYYWYGENKDRTDGKNPVWTWGIRAYRSTDLYNWEDMGLIIQPDLADKNSGLYPTCHVDRPHIIKCPNTGKYVCWIKQSGEEACFLILQADAFTGPYTIVHQNYRPFGYQVGDFDMTQQDGVAYLYMDADHRGVVSLRLSSDYLQAEQELGWQYTGLHAPFCREGVAVFAHEGKCYMLTSGMSGYVPNRSDSAVADHWTQPFVSLGDPHVNDSTHASFNSQISQVFKIPGKKDLYLTIADRWVPDYPMDAALTDAFERVMAARYEPERYHATAEESRIVMQSPMLESANTSRADYVWLPLTFENGRPVIHWKDSWSIEDYE